MTGDALQVSSAPSGVEIQRALQRRLEEFARAMSTGGRRESYESWQASRTALAAAVEIVAILEKGND